MTADELIKSYADRVLRGLEDVERAKSHVADIYLEIKSKGLNATAFRKVIRDMLMDPEKREALEFDIDAYRLAVGLDRVQADKMLSEGKGIRETNRATGVPLATLHRRSKAIAKTENGTDRASNARRAPEGGGEGVSSSPEPITESSEGAATSPHRAAAGTLSLPTPSLDPEYAADAARNYTEAVGSIRAGIVERGEARLHTRLPSMDEALVDFDPVRDLPPWCDKRRARGGRGAIMTTPYRPTSGTEGAAFMERFCDRCEREAGYRLDPFKHDACPIAATTMALRVTDPGYPKEWVEDDDGPRCTAFQSAPAGEGA